MKTDLFKITCFLILTVMLFTNCVTKVYAQDVMPTWAENLSCDPAIQKYQGVEYCTGTILSEDGNSSLAHVVVIDLNSTGLRIEYIIPDGVNGEGVSGECKDVNRSTKYLAPPRGPGCDDPNNRSLYPVMSIEDAVMHVNENDLAVLINGDYSACTLPGCDGYRDHGPEGLAVVRGNRLDGPRMGDGDNNIVKRPWLAISEISPLRAEFHQFNSDNGSLPYDWIYTGVGGAPWLIQEGEVLEGAIRVCEGAAGSCYDYASQTAVGLTKDKRWMFFVVGITPPKLLDLARFMDEKLDAWQAIKLDGGGSSQLYYGGASDPYIVGGDRRLLANFLEIVASPGSGIDLPVEPPIQLPSPEPNWWDKLRQNISDGFTNFFDSIRGRIDNWWQGLKQSFEEKINQWWKDTQRNITDMFKQRLSEWLNQTCGLGWIPAGSIAGILYRHHRKIIKKKK